jgi:hypothetical protein
MGIITASELFSPSGKNGSNRNPEAYVFKQKTASNEAVLSGIRRFRMSGSGIKLEYEILEVSRDDSYQG